MGAFAKIGGHYRDWEEENYSYNIGIQVSVHAKADEQQVWYL